MRILLIIVIILNILEGFSRFIETMAESPETVGAFQRIGKGFDSATTALSIAAVAYVVLFLVKKK